MWLQKVKAFAADIEIARIRMVAEGILGADAQVSVSELRCAEPDCPPVKTVLMIFKEGSPTRSVSVHRPLRQVTEHDVFIALS